MNYNWNWGVFFQTIPAGDETYLTWVIHGLGWTIAISLCAWVIALVLGSIAGTLRTVPNKKLAFIGHTWVEFFRNVPLLMQLFLWFFVVPELLPRDLAMWVKQDMPAKEFLTAVVALGLFTSARVAEQVRAGIQALPRGQRNAGLALGLTQTQTYRFVLLPMAFRIIIPPLTSEFMNAFKNSGVAYAVGVWELVFVSRQMVEETGGQVIESLIVPTVLYIVCAYAANRVMAVIESRAHVPGFIVAK
ncbi:MAG: glutamate ABC transporter permease [Candidatus Dactylopiibacterium carminicum]|uniref:Amino acid ABC transporter permease n=1 Tax=Candidatus Dactylopiibacterium carminicum TaxID=857335 RepID=A0A272EUG6_9RHOO|nr:amino acid ABC transporter permease [Candidatus Dactylopiibacterium carminicum]KAF7599781.1 amino acid ABC transporter permease [Candidatus Dactylopiibacterium carminicum]PAS93735.1 MAG: glutamate ABC transporter permease [Candidatus Dactylopiibacterium carminicum]PAS98264.1 MAG: glutamate ABC transporter permease [Candidatus Dactylopiibacterium carminicum]PAS99782.1 MAG: glutamate ABC transporter permease [Candidatus Dactylopiibacterium carminicum]